MTGYRETKIRVPGFVNKFRIADLGLRIERLCSVKRKAEVDHYE